MPKQRKVLAIFIALAGLFASQTGSAAKGRKIGACELALLRIGPLGADVALIYPNVKIRMGSRGELIVPVGSKAFAYWRERTPSSIPDTAFAFQYLKKHEMRDSVAMQSAAAVEENAILAGKAKLGPEDRPPEELPSEEARPEGKQAEPVREDTFQIEDHTIKVKDIHSSFLSVADIQARWAEKVAAEEDAHAYDRISLGKTDYLYVEGIPGHSLIFFYGDEGMAHQRAKKLILRRFPAATIGFGGSLEIRAKKYKDGSFSIASLDMGDGAWLKDHSATAEETLAQMMLALAEQFNLDRDAVVSLSGQWSQVYGPKETPYRELISRTPITLSNEMTSLGMLTSQKLRDLRFNKELKAKLVQPGHDSPSVGYVAFQRPGQGMEMIFFPKKAEPLHNFAFYLISGQYPGAKLLFGGSLIFNFVAADSREIDFISVNWDGFARDPAFDGDSSFRALVSGLRAELNFSTDTRLLIPSADWREAEVVKARGSLPTISELGEALKPKPGPERDAILTIDPTTGEIHVNTEAPEFKQWRLTVSPHVKDWTFAHDMLSENEMEAAEIKRRRYINQKTISLVEQQIKFVNLTADGVSLKIPERLSGEVKPIREVLGNVGARAHDTLTFKYTIFRKGDEFLILAWGAGGSSHGTVIDALILANPGLRVLWADYVCVSYERREDQSGKLSSVEITGNDGGMIRDDRLDVFFDSSESIAEFFGNTNISTNSLLAHQIISRLEAQIDEQTEIKLK